MLRQLGKAQYTSYMGRPRVYTWPTLLSCQMSVDHDSWIITVLHLEVLCSAPVLLTEGCAHVLRYATGM